jgi:hypothetical protein
MRGRLHNEKTDNLCVIRAMVCWPVRCNSVCSKIPQMNSWLADVCVRLKAQTVK